MLNNFGIKSDKTGAYYAEDFLAGVALLFSAPAFAADLAIAPAPAPVAYASWTGFYVGVHAGAASQSISSGSFIDPNGNLASGNVSGGSAMGAVGGIQAGYNWQFAPAWVAGVEGDFSWTSLSDQRATPSDTDVVVQDIDAAPTPPRGLDHCRKRRLLGDVCFECDAFAARLSRHGDRLLGGGEVVVHRQHPGALLRETHNRGTAVADALAGRLTGAHHNGDLVLQTHANLC